MFLVADISIQNYKKLLKFVTIDFFLGIRLPDLIWKWPSHSRYFKRLLKWSKKEAKDIKTCLTEKGY